MIIIFLSNDIWDHVLWILIWFLKKNDINFY